MNTLWRDWLLLTTREKIGVVIILSIAALVIVCVVSVWWAVLT